MGLSVVMVFASMAMSGCGSTTTTAAASSQPTSTSQAASATTSAAEVSTTQPFETTTSSIEPATELLIFAAAGAKSPIDAAAAAFESEYGTKITVNYGGGGEVLSNMVLAKKGDIFIAPEQRFMDSAKKQGAVGESVNPTPLAYMIPVIGVQRGNPKNIQSLADLSASGVKLVVGNPDTTLLGQVVPDILQAAGVSDAVTPNIVANVSQVNTIITDLKTGQADAGFIWHYFGTTASADVDIIWIPREYVTAMGQIQAAVTTYSTEPETAGLFIDFLSSEQGKAIFAKDGYFVDAEEAAQHWRGSN